ncbi:hypothetical protein LINPERPRIM_LOCUS40941 [Linum perenne]
MKSWYVETWQPLSPWSKKATIRSSSWTTS